MNCILCCLPLSLPWGVCSECIKHLSDTSLTCLGCGLPLLNINQPCYYCLDFKPAWHALTAFTDYRPPLSQLIYQFKSRQKTQLSYGLARLIFLAWYHARECYGLAKPDIVTCVPLSRSRYWLRGYNQSQLLAQHIAHWLDSDFKPYLLSRHYGRLEQKLLSKSQRACNVKNTFSCYEDLTGKTIAVIDDIVTTGYTVHELSKQLKKQGALHIQILCLCRTRL